MTHFIELTVLKDDIYDIRCTSLKDYEDIVLILSQHECYYKPYTVNRSLFHIFTSIDGYSVLKENFS